MRTERQIDINGLPIHYSQAGHGRPVLLLHGLLGGSFCWRFNIEALAEKYRIYALDLPGAGLSDAPPETDCSMKAQAARAFHFVQALDLKDLTVIGTSWGGAVALLVAAIDAETPSRRIRSLVLCSPVNPWSAFGKKRIKFFKSRVGSSFLKIVWPVSRPIHGITLDRVYGDRSRIAPGTLEGYVAMIWRPERVHNTLNMMRNWQADIDELQQRISKICIPTLLIWGDKDGAVDIRSAEKLRQTLPACELTVFTDVGHLPFEEVPNQFNARVFEFLGG